MAHWLEDCMCESVGKTSHAVAQAEYCPSNTDAESVTIFADTHYIASKHMLTIRSIIPTPMLPTCTITSALVPLRVCRTHQEFWWCVPEHWCAEGHLAVDQRSGNVLLCHQASALATWLGQGLTQGLKQVVSQLVLSGQAACTANGIHL